VTVRRVWPDRLQIQVVEQRPVAYWGTDALLNDRGLAFRPAPASFPSGLPRLAGPLGSERRVLLRYRDLSARFAERNLRIAELELTARRAWRLRIDGGPRVLLGRSDFDRRVERLVRVLDRVAGPADAARAQIDLRYTNGMAVRLGAQTDLSESTGTGPQ
jgi:cell division protein FtsQ